MPTFRKNLFFSYSHFNVFFNLNCKHWLPKANALLYSLNWNTLFCGMFLICSPFSVMLLTVFSSAYSLNLLWYILGSWIFPIKIFYHKMYFVQMLICILSYCVNPWLMLIICEVTKLGQIFQCQHLYNIIEIPQSTFCHYVSRYKSIL